MQYLHRASLAACLVTRLIMCLCAVWCCCADHTAFSDRIPAWEKSGVKVIQVRPKCGLLEVYHVALLVWFSLTGRVCWGQGGGRA